MRMRWQDAKKALEKIGFVAVRSKSHIIMQRGHIKLVLPHTGNTNQATGKIIRRLEAGFVPEPREMRQLALDEPEIALDPDIPLTVLHLGQRHTIVADEGEHWRLRSHKDGKVASVLKTMTAEDKEPLMPELSVLPGEGEPVEDDQPKSGVFKEPVIERPSPLTNPSDQLALVRLTQRRMEALKVERDQLFNKLQGLETQYQASVDFLNSLGVSIEIEAFGSKTRSVASNGYNPVGNAGHNRSGPKYSPAERQKIRMAVIDCGGVNAKATDVELRAKETYKVDISNGYAYYAIQRFKKEA